MSPITVVRMVRRLVLPAIPACLLALSAFLAPSAAAACPGGHYAHSGIGFEGCAPIPGYNDAPGVATSAPGSAADMAADVYSRGYYQSPEYYEMMNHLLGDPIPPGMERPGSAAPAMAIPRLEIPEGSRLVHQSLRSIWIIFHNSPHAGQGCAAVFSQDGDLLILSGPHGPRPGTITFMSAGIPRPEGARETQITLSAAGRPANVRAIHLGSGENGVLIVPTMIEDTLPSIGDSESLSVSLDGREVYSVETEEAFKARDALRECLAGEV